MASRISGVMGGVMAEVATWEIESEDSLWGILDQVAKNPDIGAGGVRFLVRGWQPQLLYFPERAIGHSVRPATARAIADFHASVARAYALVVYGEANRQFLRTDDKEALDLIFLVTVGSNGVSLTAEAIQKFFESMVSKMSGGQVMGVAIVVALLYFGHDTAKEFYAASLEEKLAEKRIDEHIALSAQETERMRLITEAMEQFGITMQLKAEADEGKRALLRPSLQEGRSRVLGVDLTRRQAKTILSAERAASVGKRLDGVYEVVDINTENEEGFSVRLRNVETGDEFTAEATYAEMTAEDIHVIFEAAEAKSIFDGAINAFYVGDKISKAFIVRADMVTEME